MRILMAVLAMVLGGSATAWAQSSATLDTPYQLRFVPKLKKGDTINLANAGALGSSASLCAHVYVSEPGGQMVACCSCPLPPLQTRSLGIGADVFEGVKPPKAGLIKILGAATVGGTCNAASPGALSVGLSAWKGELQFLPATLSAGELSGLITRCGILNPTPKTCPVCAVP